MSIHVYMLYVFSLRDKEGPRGPQPPPLLRSSTLPAIIVPGLSILHAQIGPNSTPNGMGFIFFVCLLSTSYVIIV